MPINENTTAIASKYFYLTSLISGGIAGFVVDVVLFPIDTFKTRLQSEKKFWKAGGFSGIYRGLSPVAAGSVPSAALFFCTYESAKSILTPSVSSSNLHFVHMSSAAIAEVVACIVRVPVEIAKQRRQVLSSDLRNRSAISILSHAYQTEGIRKGLYRGFGATIFREIPFAFIQYPLWEYLKIHWTTATGVPSTFVSVAICGALAGGFAACVTTPLDVTKTRIMLAERYGAGRPKITSVMKGIYRENGFSGLFAGVVPRVLWITIGGAIFFGSYDLSTKIMTKQIQTH